MEEMEEGKNVSVDPLGRARRTYKRSSVKNEVELDSLRMNYIPNMNAAMLTRTTPAFRTTTSRGLPLLARDAPPVYSASSRPPLAGAKISNARKKAATKSSDCDGFSGGSSASTSTTARSRRFSTATALPVKPRLGFIGLGNMGLPMCANLARKATQSGFTDAKVLAFDKFPERTQLLVSTDSDDAVASNVEVAASVKQIAAECDIVFTMLFNTATTEEVYRGAEGLFENAKKSRSTLFVDSTTIAPSFAKELGASGAEKGFSMMDAPVSGGVAGATAGTLAFMCGASSEQVFEDRGKPFLMHMGTNIFYCGASGSGSVAKVCNNMALSVQMISVAEAISLGVKLGMDPALLCNVMNKSSARCWSGEVQNPCPDVLPNAPSSRDYEKGFKMSLMVKDLTLAIENAKSCDANVEMAAFGLKNYYEDLHEKGFSDKDFSYVYQKILKSNF